MSETKREYAANYRKPPLHTRFKKGQSGNPRGRPKKDLPGLLVAALNEPVFVTTNGRRRKITKREAIVTQMVNESAGANLRATKMLIDMMKDIEKKTFAERPPESHRFAPADEEVSGIDAAEALLAIARSRVPEGDFHQGDIEELPFTNEMFDVVAGFNAFQYAAEPIAALAEARRVTKPGGTIVVMTWGNPEALEAATLIAALRPLMPPPPPGAPGPFALSAEDALRKFASDAKLTPVAVFDVESPFEYPDEATAVRGLNAAGVAVRAMENTSEKAVSEAHAKAVAPFRQSDGRYRIKASFRCLLARP